jgi:hypothetical protein
VNEKIKSAYELAMENLAKKDPSSAPKSLTDEQKAAIEKIRNNYKAKIAERQIMLKSKLAELPSATSVDSFHVKKQELEEKHHTAVKVLELEMERQVKKIRDIS